MLQKSIVVFVILLVSSSCNTHNNEVEKILTWDKGNKEICTTLKGITNSINRSAIFRALGTDNITCFILTSKFAENNFSGYDLFIHCGAKHIFSTLQQEGTLIKYSDIKDIKTFPYSESVELIQLKVHNELLTGTFLCLVDLADNGRIFKVVVKSKKSDSINDGLQVF